MNNGTSNNAGNQDIAELAGKKIAGPQGKNFDMESDFPETQRAKPVDWKLGSIDEHPQAADAILKGRSIMLNPTPSAPYKAHNTVPSLPPAHHGRRAQ